MNNFKHILLSLKPFLSPIYSRQRIQRLHSHKSASFSNSATPLRDVNNVKLNPQSLESFQVKLHRA